MMKRSTKAGKCSIFLILCLAAFGCAGYQPSNSANTGENGKSASPAASEKRTVMDDLGRTIELKGEVLRVVSLAPNVTELIFAAGGGDRLVGVTSFCNFPEEAKGIAKIGDTMNPNMESIVEAFTKTLDKNGILYYVTNPTTLDGVLYNIRQVADILGTTDKAEPVIASLRERIGKVWAKTSSAEKVRVFVQISREPLFTIGRESFLNEPLVKAGAVSATADVETAFPRLSKEAARALNPSVIVLTDSEDNREPNEVFKNSPAVTNGRVYRIDADLLSRPGPRLVDAVEQLAALLHPELFKREE
jgi:iron complex transport system substrate-binding protein